MNIKSLSIIFSSITLVGLSMNISPESDFSFAETNALEESNYVYVDLSLNANFGSSPLLKYNEASINLVSEGNDIYKSESVVPSGVSLKVTSNDNTYQTASFSLESNYNYVCVSSDTSIKGFGIYSSKTQYEDATYKTQRVWLDNNNIYFYDNNCVNAVGYLYESNWCISLMSEVSNSYDGLKYYFVDIPYQITSIHFYRLSGIENHNYLIYNDVTIPALSYGVCYGLSATSLDDFNNINPIIVYNADANMLAAVVTAYLTYGKDNSNGSTKSTVSNLKRTWFDKKSATKEQLKDTTILDYTGYAANGNKYDENTPKTASYSVNEKWNTMMSQGGARGGLDLLSWFKGTTGKIVLVISIAAIITIGGFIGVTIYRRKKRKAESI